MFSDFYFLLCMWIIFNMYILLITSLRNNMYSLCPKELYSNTKLNKFGISMIFTILFVILPFYYVHRRGGAAAFK